MRWLLQPQTVCDRRVLVFVRFQGGMTMPGDLSRGEMPYRVLGRTGEQVSTIGLGGWHLGLSYVDQALSVRIVREAIDRGINFLDNSWDYNGGESEIRMGAALKNGYRQKAFVMTKIDGRSKAEATRQLNESLRRLGTDCIDLVQHHEVIRFEDPHRIFDEEGANAALVEGDRQESFATSVLRAIRTRAFTCTCSRSPTRPVSRSTPFRCL
jgi:aryl-alcohol dehydrogenase-like predicted oxidoreductase